MGTDTAKIRQRERVKGRFQSPFTEATFEERKSVRTPLHLETGMTLKQTIRQLHWTRMRNRR